MLMTPSFFTSASGQRRPHSPKDGSGRWISSVARGVAARAGLLFFYNQAGTLADSWSCGGSYPRNTARVRGCNIGNLLGAAE